MIISRLLESREGHVQLKVFDTVSMYTCINCCKDQDQMLDLNSKEELYQRLEKKLVLGELYKDRNKKN